MGEDPGRESRREFRGIERDIWIEEQIEQLTADFFAAIDAGDEERAREHVARFEASMERLPPRLRHEVVSETTVMLGEELTMRRETGPGSGRG
ncbi:MAG TPA: hypothetical protein VGI21_03155 [Streptosporangiaceae bacterium]|jgi:hypothetical protein